MNHWDTRWRASAPTVMPAHALSSVQCSSTSGRRARSAAIRVGRGERGGLVRVHEDQATDRVRLYRLSGVTGLHPMLLGIQWMDPNWLLDQFGTAFFWISLVIIFIECGLLFPFLPGDTLLFALGLFIADRQARPDPGSPTASTSPSARRVHGRRVRSATWWATR